MARSGAVGRDTDSNAATVGSVFGALHGAAAIPAELRAAGGERLTSAVAGFDGIEISALAERSLRLATTQAISQLTRVDRRLKALFDPEGLLNPGKSL